MRVWLWGAVSLLLGVLTTALTVQHQETLGDDKDRFIKVGAGAALGGSVAKLMDMDNPNSETQIGVGAAVGGIAGFVLPSLLSKLEKNNNEEQTHTKVSHHSRHKAVPEHEVVSEHKLKKSKQLSGDVDDENIGDSQVVVRSDIDSMGTQQEIAVDPLDANRYGVCLELFEHDTAGENCRGMLGTAQVTEFFADQLHREMFLVARAFKRGQARRGMLFAGLGDTGEAPNAIMRHVIKRSKVATTFRCHAKGSKCSAKSVSENRVPASLGTDTQCIVKLLTDPTYGKDFGMQKRLKQLILAFSDTDESFFLAGSRKVGAAAVVCLRIAARGAGSSEAIKLLGCECETMFGDGCFDNVALKCMYKRYTIPSSDTLLDLEEELSDGDITLVDTTEHNVVVLEPEKEKGHSFEEDQDLEEEVTGHKKRSWGRSSGTLYASWEITRPLQGAATPTLVLKTARDSLTYYAKFTGVTGFTLMETSTHLKIHGTRYVKPTSASNRASLELIVRSAGERVTLIDELLQLQATFFPRACVQQRSDAVAALGRIPAAIGDGARDANLRKVALQTDLRAVSSKQTYDQLIKLVTDIYNLWHDPKFFAAPVIVKTDLIDYNGTSSMDPVVSAGSEYLRDLYRCIIENELSNTPEVNQWVADKTTSGGLVITQGDLPAHIAKLDSQLDESFGSTPHGQIRTRTIQLLTSLTGGADFVDPRTPGTILSRNVLDRLNAPQRMIAAYFLHGNQDRGGRKFKGGVMFVDTLPGEDEPDSRDMYTRISPKDLIPATLLTYMAPCLVGKHNDFVHALLYPDAGIGSRFVVAHAEEVDFDRSPAFLVTILGNLEAALADIDPRPRRHRYGDYLPSAFAAAWVTIFQERSGPYKKLYQYLGTSSEPKLYYKVGDADLVEGVIDSFEETKYKDSIKEIFQLMRR